MKATLFAAFVGTVSAQGIQTLWGQCGGVNFSGPSSCVPTASCLVLNPYYYQCVPTPTTSLRSTTTSTTSCILRGYTQVQRICNRTTRTIFGSICQGSPTPQYLTVFCDTTTTPCELTTYSQTYASCFGSFGTVYGSVCSGSRQTSLPMPTVRCTTTAVPIKARRIKVNKVIKRVDTVVKAQEYGRRRRVEM